MDVINETRFRELSSAGEISHSNCQFIDGIRIGLRANSSVLTLPPTVDANNTEWPSLNCLDLSSAVLLPGHFYLATTVEKIAVSARIFGMLHTRSHWARLGLDCFGSSTHVSPGFGGGIPTSIVLELRPQVSIQNLESEVFLAGLVLFELNEPVRIGSTGHQFRLPFHPLEYHESSPLC